MWFLGLGTPGLQKTRGQQTTPGKLRATVCSVKIDGFGQVPARPGGPEAPLQRRTTSTPRYSKESRSVFFGQVLIFEARGIEVKQHTVSRNVFLFFALPPSAARPANIYVLEHVVFLGLSTPGL